MNSMELIMTRKSVRTFDGRPLTDSDKEKLRAFIATISNPYGIPVKFVLLDAEEHGLSSPVIQGEHLYIAGKVQKVEHCEEAFGYSFEQLVLYAWSQGIGTTWIGGTMKRELFEAAAQVEEGELMPIVSPLGYPAKEKSEVDAKLRNSVHGDDRLPASELFFDGDFSRPLQEMDPLLQAGKEQGPLHLPGRADACTGRHPGGGWAGPRYAQLPGGCERRVPRAL